ncbi:MAG: electron transport complex subunit RsxG [Pseudomonadales bacterium]|nr:electron transport complex subunit RsxG [Pseudomonadales bacterium]
MDQELKQSIKKNSLLLAAFALSVALSVGLVNELTREQIIFQFQEAERRALFEVLPPASHNNDLLHDNILLEPLDPRFRNLDLLGLSAARKAYTARLDGRISGVILPLEVHDGYSGDIVMLVGIDAAARITGVRVISHRETPGLGDKVDLRVSEWILGFDGKSLQNPPVTKWLVKKDGGDFDQFTGATITPRAVVNGVRKALLFFSENRTQLLGE